MGQLTRIRPAVPILRIRDKCSSTRVKSCLERWELAVRVYRDLLCFTRHFRWRMAIAVAKHEIHVTGAFLPTGRKEIWDT